MTSHVARTTSAVVLSILAGACATPEPFDYGPYLDHMPRSILVLPPTNASVEPLAPYNYLSVVSMPLAERGYYVFPVAIVDDLLKQNGLPTPTEMHTADLGKIREIIGADAVLYLHVHDWGTSYQVLNSQTTVQVSGSLVDTRTGTPIWQGAATLVDNSSSGESNIIGMAISGLVDQIASTLTDRSHDLAGQHAAGWWWGENRGLLLGPRHADHAAQQSKLRQGPAQ